MNKIVIEFLGTMLLSLVRSLMSNAYITGTTFILLKVLTHSLSSFNPAFTIVMLIERKISQTNAIQSILAQIVGAIFGFLIYKIVHK